MTNNTDASESEIIKQPSNVQFGATDLALILMTFIWGMNFVIVKTLIGDITPLAFVSIRFVLGAVLLFVVVRVREGGFQIPRAAWGRVAVVGIVGTTLYQPLYITGLSLTKVSNAALIVACTPVLIVLFNRVLRKERFTARGWAGIACCFAGIAAVVLSGGEVALGDKSLIGDLLLVIATCGWALYSVLAAPLLKKYSSLSVTALSIIFGTIPLVLIGLPAMLSENWAAISPAGWGGLLYSAIFAIVIAYVIWNVGVKRLGGARTAIYNNLTPVIATAGAAIFLNEPLAPIEILGAVIIFVGLYLARTANIIIEPEG